MDRKLKAGQSPRESPRKLENQPTGLQVCQKVDLDQCLDRPADAGCSEDCGCLLWDLCRGRFEISDLGAGIRVEALS